MSDTQDQPKNDEIPSQESPQYTSNQDLRVVVDNNGEKYIRAGEAERLPNKPPYSTRWISRISCKRTSSLNFRKPQK